MERERKREREKEREKMYDQSVCIEIRVEISKVLKLLVMKQNRRY